MTAWPVEIERMFLEMEADRLERERAAVLADPVKHKLTLHFPEGASLNYRYRDVQKARWPHVRYCYSTGRNLAGYFLCWRETVNKDGTGKRDQWFASKRRKTVQAKMRSRTESHRGRVQQKAVKPLEERRTTYYISEKVPGPTPNVTGSRGLGKVVTTGGPNNALDIARGKWPNATGELVAIHIGRRS